MGNQTKKKSALLSIVSALFSKILTLIGGGILFIIVFGFLLFFFIKYPISGFFVSSNTFHFLDNLEKGLNSDEEFVYIQKIYPDKNWDTVCAIPPYSLYSSKKDEYKKYFGENFESNWFNTPNTYAANYGYGFSFIYKGTLQKFIRIPKVYNNLFDGALIKKIPVYVQVNGHNLETERFIMQSTKKDRDVCFARSSAFIKYVNFNKLIIGE